MFASPVTNTVRRLFVVCCAFTHRKGWRGPLLPPSARRVIAGSVSFIPVVGVACARRMSSPPITHAASHGNRTMSIQSHDLVHGGISHCIKISGDAQANMYMYHSGMRPLEDISARWRQNGASATSCWPTARDDTVVAQRPKGTWQHITGNFYTTSTANDASPRSPRTMASQLQATPSPYTGRVMLNLVLPGPASPRFLMPATAASVNVPGAASATGRPLLPRYLNNRPEAGRFDHLPPPWGPKIASGADNIQRRWPTMAA